MAFGLENCQVCGAVTNMGSLEIVNPLEFDPGDEANPDPAGRRRIHIGAARVRRLFK